MQTISEKIQEYRGEDVYPFHMPGHKRNTLKYMGEYDYTEIDGFDNLYKADGIIAESQRRAAELFGADRTFFLVNGSTVGIMAAVMAAGRKNEKKAVMAAGSQSAEEKSEAGGMILIGPDCHKSVFNALKLGRLTGVTTDRTVIASAETGSDKEAAAALTDLEGMQRELDWNALPEKIERILGEYNSGTEADQDSRTERRPEKGGRQPRITAVVITSPTYEGIVSDVKRIADIAHRHGAALIVDEAHGTHFGMHPYFPENSNRLGADAVIQSMHKTMTGLTQTALLHINGGRIDPNEALRYLEMLQTSSPSYLLMNSIDECVALLEQNRNELFAEYVNRLECFRSEMRKMSRLRLFETEHFDRGKLILTVRIAAGEKNRETVIRQIYTELRDEHGIQPEMAGDDYILLMTSFADTDEGFERLLAACREIDARLARGAETENGDAAHPAPVRKTECYRMN